MLNKERNISAQFVGVLPHDQEGPVDCQLEPVLEAALEGSVIDRFDAIATRYAERLAVGDECRSLSYSELSCLVERIAAAIARATGDRPGQVAILLRNEARYPAAMLGVLASGRAFVSLESDYPIEHNRMIAAHAKVVALISAEDLAATAAEQFPPDLALIDIDRLAEDRSRAPPPKADDLAYVIYTSGSTGAPKGVYQNHRGILHEVWKYTKTADLGFKDRLALIAAPSLFVSVKLSLLGLLNGASLHCLVPGRLTPAAIASKVRELGITVMWLVPQLLRHITEGLGPSEKLDTLRFIHLAGDRVDWGDFDAFRRACSPQACLRTGLGTTECGGITHWIVDEQLRGTSQRLPVGQAFRDLTLTIVDDEGRPVADGDVGELHVSGRYIALGYWQDPEQTARTFVTDPVDPGRRTYKTGDLALRRPDGLFEYVGRKDRQIKLSGQRIELGEVESALRSCHGVRDAAVVVRRDDNGMPRQLAAYCELESAVTELLPRHLSAMLAKELPLFMMPRSITILDALPRLSNFKIDHEELRRRDPLEREQNLQVAPRTKIQEILLELWRDVLKRQDIDCDDDFFLCGGDSLSAVDLLHRIEKELQYQLPLTILPEAPTVTQFEARLKTATWGPVNMIRIHTAGRRRPLFAVHGAYGHFQGLLPILRSLGPDQPVYALQPPEMGTGAGCRTLQHLAANYIGEIKTVQPHGPYRLLGASFDGVVVFEMALQLQKIGEPIEFLAMMDTNPPTCLSEDGADFWPERKDVPKTHLQMLRNYVLDSRSDQNVFRGELTYIFCTGNPIVARSDRRRLWQRFAYRFRLLQLASPHDVTHRGSRLENAAFQNLLHASLDGEQQTGSDPASVYDRAYRFDNRDQREIILGLMGDVYHIEQDRKRGRVEEVRIDAEALQFVGWAVEPCRQQPAQTIAVFLDDRFLGYGASCELRPDVAKYLDATSAQYAGFNFCFRRGAAAGVMEKPRLFVLSSDGHAAELQSSVEPATIGSVVKLSNTEPLRVILSGDWSQRETWGVWSDGHRAAVIFDASSLPDRFTVAIEARFFPPGPSPIQNVRIFDDNGYLLTTISNELPNGNFVVKIKLSCSQPRKWTSLIFDVDTPTSPQELRISGDLRRLGIGLVSLTFRECTSLTSIDPGCQSC